MSFKQGDLVKFTEEVVETYRKAGEDVTGTYRVTVAASSPNCVRVKRVGEPTARQLTVFRYQVEKVVP